MVGADLVRLAGQGILAALLIVGAPALWIVALLAGVTGAATGFFNPAATGLLPAVVGPERLYAANGLRATAMGGGEVLGPAVAGVLVATTSPGWALAIDAATFAVSVAMLVRLRLPARLPRAATSFVTDLRGGWDAFRSRTWVWAFVAFAAFANLLWGAWSVLGPVVADRALGGAAAWGAILAALGVGAVLGGLAAIRTAPRRPLVTAALAFSTTAVPLALLATEAAVALIALGALVLGAGMFLGNSVWESTLQRHVPAASLSRVSAYDWFGSLALQPLGLAIWGPTSVAIGIEASLWLASALFLASTLLLLAVPGIRRPTATGPVESGPVPLAR